jgi:PIN domain nuclease of toxin-antitoxin system
VKDAPRPTPPRGIDLCLDSSAVCTLILQERGWDAIHRTIQHPEVSGYLPGPALTETIAVVRRKGNQSSPEQIYQALLALGLSVLHPTDQDLVRAAELIEISADNPGPPPKYSDREATLSLGDAMILAITEVRGYKVLTRDTYWKWMVEEKLLDVGVIVP